MKLLHAVKTPISNTLTETFSLISEAYLKVFGCSLMMNSRSAIGLQEMNVEMK